MVVGQVGGESLCLCGVVAKNRQWNQVLRGIQPGKSADLARFTMLFRTA